MSESTVALEVAELEACADLYRAANLEVVAASGLAVAEVADAVLHTVTRDAPSFRNLRRLGFEVAYRRPNYLWTAGP